MSDSVLDAAELAASFAAAETGTLPDDAVPGTQLTRAELTRLFWTRFDSKGFVPKERQFPLWLRSVGCVYVWEFALLRQVFPTPVAPNHSPAYTGVRSTARFLKNRGVPLDLGSAEILELVFAVGKMLDDLRPCMEAYWTAYEAARLEKLDTLVSLDCLPALQAHGMQYGTDLFSAPLLRTCPWDNEARLWEPARLIRVQGFLASRDGTGVWAGMVLYHAARFVPQALGLGETPFPMDLTIVAGMPSSTLTLVDPVSLFPPSVAPDVGRISGLPKGFDLRQVLAAAEPTEVPPSEVDAPSETSSDAPSGGLLREYQWLAADLTNGVPGSGESIQTESAERWLLLHGLSGVAALAWFSGKWLRKMRSVTEEAARLGRYFTNRGTSLRRLREALPSWLADTDPGRVYVERVCGLLDRTVDKVCYVTRDVSAGREGHRALVQNSIRTVHDLLATIGAERHPFLSDAVPYHPDRFRWVQAQLRNHHGICAGDALVLDPVFGLDLGAD